MAKETCLLLVALLVGGVFSCGRREEPSESRELKSQAQEFVELLAQEDFPAAVASFDSVMKDAMPSDKLREVWKGLVAESGAFKRHTAARMEKVQQYDVVFVTCEFEKRILDIKVVFDSTGQVSGLWFVPPQSSGG